MTDEMIPETDYEGERESIAEFYERLDARASSGLDAIRNLRGNEDGTPINAGTAAEHAEYLAILAGEAVERAVVVEKPAAQPISDDERKRILQEERDKPEDYWRSLQGGSAHVRDRSKVNWHGESVPSGGGGGGGGAPKSGKGSGGIVIASVLSNGPRPDSASGIVGTTVRRFRVAGLSLGVRDFYDRRPGEIATVLRDLAHELVAERTPTESLERLPPTRGLSIVDVYGLSDPAIDVLREHEGAARRRVIDHAMATDRGRIEAIDRSVAS